MFAQGSLDPSLDLLGIYVYTFTVSGNFRQSQRKFTITIHDLTYPPVLEPAIISLLAPNIQDMKLPFFYLGKAVKRLCPLKSGLGQPINHL